MSYREEMGDLYACCIVLANLLEEIGSGNESLVQYTFAFSRMNQ
jgi:hypothetical protein